MKKFLILLLTIPVLAFAASNPPWEDFYGPSDWSNPSMTRLSIPHGWLVINKIHTVDGESNTTTFVPDEYHEWVLNTNLKVPNLKMS